MFGKKKEKKKRLCPFFKLECNPECVLYREGFRYFEATPENPKPKPMPFEECALNILVDTMENALNRQIGMQKAMEGARNEIAATRSFFYSLASSVAEKKGIEAAIERGMQMKHISELEKELKGEAVDQEEVVDADFTKDEVKNIA